MLVSWHLATQQKTDVRTYETPAYGGYHGYGPYNRYSNYSCWSCMPTRTEVSVQDYTEGTFIVDMIDPVRLQGYDIPLSRIRRALERSNNDVGGRLVEMAETEYMVRGLGYIRSTEDIEQIAVAVDDRGTPIRVKDVARVQVGPELRRGIAELNGEGEVASGITSRKNGVTGCAFYS